MTETFGNRLKRLRLARDMSQEDLAEILGTSKQVISRYETNQRTPKITIVNEYAKKLNVSLGYLLGDPENNKKPSIENDEGLSEKKLAVIDKIKAMDDIHVDALNQLVDSILSLRDK